MESCILKKCSQCSHALSHKATFRHKGIFIVLYEMKGSNDDSKRFYSTGPSKNVFERWLQETFQKQQKKGGAPPPSSGGGKIAAFVKHL